MAQFSAGVEIFYMDTITVLSLMCIRPAIQREPAGILRWLKRSEREILTSIECRRRAYWTVSLLTCKPSWRSTELSAGNSLPLTLCCCGKPSRWYSEHAIF